MSEASDPDQPENTFNKHVALLAHKPNNVSTRDPTGDWYWPGLRNTVRPSATEWVGPLAFAKDYGPIPSIDHDLGADWGPNGDQRVSLRVEFDGDIGLLYVYDATWDEYAILGADIPVARIEDLFARSMQLGAHPSVEDLVALLPDLRTVRPSCGPEL